MGTILAINNISGGYADNVVIKKVAFSVAENEFTGIIGPNGSGKSTLFKIISRIITGYSGEIRYQGKDIKDISHNEFAKKIAVVPQDLYIPFSFSVYDFICMGRYPYLSRFDSIDESDNKIIYNSMELLDILHLKDRDLNELSGGERQRVYICQALVQEPELILLDEPTSHLDISHQVQILDLLKKLNKEKNITILIILHDLNLASEYCDRLILLNNGEIVIDNKTENVLKYDIIEKIYKTVVVVLENPVSKRPHIVLVTKGLKS